MRKVRIPAPRGAVVVFAAALALGFGAAHTAIAPGAAAGDAKIAESLFKSGKQAFTKGDFASAVSFFKKAQEESAELIEACWWRASAQEKSGEKGAALESYREYVTLFESKSASGATVSKEEQRLKGLADKAIDALAGGEKELKKLEDSFASSLLAFAKENFVRDPGVALKAVAAILEVRPEHEEALKLYEKLGGAPAPIDAGKPAAGAAGPATGPFKSVKEWNDLLAGESIKASGTVSYERGVMVVDTKSGSKVTPTEQADVGTSYAYEMDVKFVETYERGWFSGLVFGGEEGVFYTAFLGQGRVVVLRNTSTQDEMASFDMPPLDTNAWHRFGVIVKGPQIDVWLDGKKVLTWKEPGGADLDGEYGFVQQRCRTERRVYRIGSVE